jgi:hypothetical protein
MTATEEEMLDVLREMVEEDKRRAEGNGHARALRFQIKPFEAIKLSTEPNYRVVGILPRVGLVVVWGPPKCGKSFWTFDLVMHIALGWTYRGRKVQQGTVVYLALEGGPGFAARKEAWRQRHLADHDGLVPFNLIDVPVDLVADHKALIKDIEGQVSEIPAIVVIDTLNRSLNGSESKDEDMSKYIRAADTIRARFGCLVIIIHHCGVEGSRPRGHTSLTGADDAQIAVYRETDGNITVTVEHMKDGEASAPMDNKLELVEVGLNDEGDPITSCIIVPADGAASSKGRAKLSPIARAGLRALNECLADMGNPAPASDHIPQGIPCVTLKDWREYLFKHNLINREGSYREQFRRLHVTLKNADAIGIWGDFVWAVT